MGDGRGGIYDDDQQRAIGFTRAKVASRESGRWQTPFLLRTRDRPVFQLAPTRPDQKGLGEQSDQGEGGWREGEDAWSGIT